MKKVEIVLLATLLLLPNLKAEALTTTELMANLVKEDIEEKRAQEEAMRICKAVKVAADDKNGECWAFTVYPLRIDRYSQITETFQAVCDYFGWEIEVIELEDDDYFGVYLENNRHLIKKGETLYSLANKYNTSIDKLMELNPEIEDSSLIYYDTYLTVK